MECRVVSQAQAGVEYEDVGIWTWVCPSCECRSYHFCALETTPRLSRTVCDSLLTRHFDAQINRVVGY
jgi:hypothetical protein